MRQDGKCEEGATDVPQTCMEILDNDPKAKSGLYDIEVQLELDPEPKWGKVRIVQRPRVFLGLQLLETPNSEVELRISTKRIA